MKLVTWPRLAPFLYALLIVGVAPPPSHAIETQARNAIMIDDVTGTVLFEKDADAAVPPSSMSKIMTVYMVFQRLAEGSLKLDDTFVVSEKAWRKGGSKMFVNVDDRVAVEDLLRGIIVQSGNDACIVVAEGLAGGEDAFAAEMTEVGYKIGLENSVFKNASGWPQEGHVMSVRDLARLAHHTIHDFPQYYHYYAETEFTYADIMQPNRNPLLGRAPGVDGLKTGHTKDGGYGLTVSAERDGRRLILILNGLPSTRARAQESERLLEFGYREYRNYALFQKDESVVEADVWLGDAATVPLVVADGLTVTLPRKSRRKMAVTVKYDSPIPAPLVKGARIATLVVEAPGTPTLEVPLVAGIDVEKLGPFRRIGAAISYIVFGSGSE